MKFLICSDGSEQADRAIGLGISVARACAAEVTLLGIIEVPERSEGILESLRRGQAQLKDLGLPAQLIAKTGNPFREILRHTTEHKFDLVVIGAVRSGARGLFWLSSKAYKIVKEVEPPVLVVAGKAGPIKRALICSGGKDYIDHAVRLAGQVAQGLSATITLLHVLPEPPAIYAHLPKMQETTDWLLSSQSELGVNLRREKQLLESLGVPAEVKLRRGSVLEEILAEIRQGRYDLVVTGSALSSSLRTYVLGDVSRGIVNRAPCPILIVRTCENAGDPMVSFKGWWKRIARTRRSAERDPPVGGR